MDSGFFFDRVSKKGVLKESCKEKVQTANRHCRTTHYKSAVYSTTRQP